jgi:uncharacterized phage protein (TIGR01671 family)
MKREIKFRAWHKKDKVMVDVASINFWPDGVLSVLEDVDDAKPQIADSYKLMEYTGLHDKNGREIYEGDIVHAYDQEPDRDEPDYRGSEATGIVEFHGSMFMLDDDIVLDYPPILEVIGNIFENTEMLEEEQ